MYSEEYRPMTVADWILTWILLCIPIAGFLLLIYWALSSATHPSKRSWAQATFVVMFVGFFLVFFVFGTLLTELRV